MTLNKELKRLIFLIVASLIIFVVDYYLAFSQITVGTSKSLFNNFVFAIAMYSWSLFNILKHTRFNKFFLKFTIFIYSVGLISTLFLQGTLTSNIFVVILALIGLALNVFIFKGINKFVKGSSL